MQIIRRKGLRTLLLYNHGKIDEARERIRRIIFIFTHSRCSSQRTASIVVSIKLCGQRQDLVAVIAGQRCVDLRNDVRWSERVAHIRGRRIEQGCHRRPQQNALGILQRGATFEAERLQQRVIPQAAGVAEDRIQLLVGGVAGGDPRA